MNGKNVCAQFEQRISPSKDYEKLTADSISSLQASFVRAGLLLLNSCNALLSPEFRFDSSILQLLNSCNSSPTRFALPQGAK